MSKPLKKTLLSYYPLIDNKSKKSTVTPSITIPHPTTLASSSSSSAANEEPPSKLPKVDHIQVDDAGTVDIKISRLSLKVIFEMTLGCFSLEMPDCAGVGDQSVESSRSTRNTLASDTDKVYTSTDVTRALHILADTVRNKIRQQVGDNKFCIIVGAERLASKEVQMAIVLRFVDKNGSLKERFIGFVSAADSSVSTLKTEISNVLRHHGFQIDNLRGQGYDPASRMREHWNGLQVLFRNECPYAYYVHCFQYRLQLSLVSASSQVLPIWDFCSKFNNIFRLFTAVPKHPGVLTSTEEMLVMKVTSSELEDGRGSDQFKPLQQEGATQWCSHLGYVSNLIDLFGPCVEILESLSNNGHNYTIRGDAMDAYRKMETFDFVFVLHLFREMMSITHPLCQVLQLKIPDVVNAIDLVKSSKVLLQRLKEERWHALFDVAESFCKENWIDVPEMHALRKNYSKKHDSVTFEHHYHVDVFNAAIDYQLMELNHVFSENAMELLLLGSALDPRDSFRSFNVDKICELAKKFYPADFQNDACALRKQLLCFETDELHHPSFQNLSTLPDLCMALAETGKGDIYNLVDRLIRLLLTLPVYTATPERAFSAMEYVRTDLQYKMDGGFKEDNMIINIERELAMDIDLDSVVDELDSLKDQKLQLK